MKATLTYYLSDKGQKEAAKKGLEAREEQKIDCDVIVADQIDLLDISSAGTGRLYVSSIYKFDEPQTADNIFAFVAKQKVEEHKKEEAREAEHQRKHQLLSEMIAADVVNAPGSYGVYEKEARLTWNNDTFVYPADTETYRILAEYDAKCKEKTQQKQLAEEQQKQATKELKAQQLSIWVNELGNNNQQQRFAVGLLPISEILQIVEDKVVFANLAKETLYEKLTDSDLEHTENCSENRGWGEDDCTGNYKAQEASAATATQWEEIRRLAKVLNNANAQLTLQHHWAYADCYGQEDEGVIRRFSVRVKITEGGYDFIREYACPNQ